MIIHCTKKLAAMSGKCPKQFHDGSAINRLITNITRRPLTPPDIVDQALLKIILEHEPQSLVQLERLSNRKKSNLSRTLRTLESFGIVELPVHKGRLAPKVIATDFHLEFGLNS